MARLYLGPRREKKKKKLGLITSLKAVDANEQSFRNTHALLADIMHTKGSLYLMQLQ